MLRPNKDYTGYEIDREITGKFAIEKNAEYQDRIEELEKENKKLKAENEYLHKLLPEADWYIIEKQLEKRLWNDWEEDVYEDIM